MKKIEQQLRHDLEHAKSELGEVRAQIGELISKEEQLQWQVRYIGRLLGTSDETAGQAVADVVVAPAMSGPQVIEAVLRETGKPLRVMDIVQKALVKGYGGPNADQRKVFANFSSFLSRAAKRKDAPFKKVGRGLFGLSLPSVAPG